MAKKLLEQRGLSYDEDKTSWRDPIKKQELIEASGHPTVPQIWFGDQFIGGFEELEALDQKDGLKSIGAS